MPFEIRMPQYNCKADRNNADNVNMVNTAAARVEGVVDKSKIQDRMTSVIFGVHMNTRVVKNVAAKIGRMISFILGIYSCAHS